MLAGQMLVWGLLWMCPSLVHAAQTPPDEDDLLQFAPRAEQVDLRLSTQEPLWTTPSLPRVETASPKSPLCLSIAATAHLQSSGKQSFGATLLLDIPLERFGQRLHPFSSVIAQESPPKLKPPPRSKAQAPEPPPTQAAQTETKEGAWPDSTAAKPYMPPRLELTPELVKAVLQAAKKQAGLEDAAARVDAMAGRAKASALLPELRLRVSRLVDEEQALSPTEYDPHRTTASGGTSLWLEARASWRLDRLVFSDDEAAFEKMRWDRAEAGAKLSEKVLELLFAWQRAKVESEREDASEQERTLALLKRVEAELGLDALTGGVFGKKIKKGKEAQP